MSARLRFQPEPWMTHMITTRCLEGQSFMIPTAHTTQIITGCFAYSLKRFEGRITINHIVALSNHYHAIISAESQATLSSFMSHLNGCLGKELGVINHAHGHIWHRRYASHLLLDEEALIDAYKYLFANSVKEGLVEHPRDWPGLHGYKALCDEMTLEGIWINRTAWNQAKRKSSAQNGSIPNELDFAERLTLRLTPPPLWQAYPPAQLRALYQRWADEVTHEYAHMRQISGDIPLGIEGILNQNPRQRRSIKSTPRPLCRSGCPLLFAQHHSAYRVFHAQYKVASRLLRQHLARHNYTPPQIYFPHGGVPLFCGKQIDGY